MLFPFDRKPLNISITHVVSPKRSFLLADEPRMQTSLTLWSPWLRLRVLAVLLHCDQHCPQHPMGFHFCFALFHEDKLQRKQLAKVYKWFPWRLMCSVRSLSTQVLALRTCRCVRTLHLPPGIWLNSGMTFRSFSKSLSTDILLGNRWNSRLVLPWPWDRVVRASAPVPKGLGFSSPSRAGTWLQV